MAVPIRTHLYAVVLQFSMIGLMVFLSSASTMALLFSIQLAYSVVSIWVIIMSVYYPKTDWISGYQIWFHIMVFLWLLYTFVQCGLAYYAGYFEQMVLSSLPQCGWFGNLYLGLSTIIVILSFLTWSKKWRRNMALIRSMVFLSCMSLITFYYCGKWDVTCLGWHTTVSSFSLLGVFILCLSGFAFNMIFGKKWRAWM